ncbi:MAG TPA: hypothetical protein VL242_49795 [Sorangium sp.]|nr:hypothetical protein [Sorangium sp.]
MRALPPQASGRRCAGRPRSASTAEGTPANPSDASLSGANPKDGARCEHGRDGQDGARASPTLAAGGQGGAGGPSIGIAYADAEQLTLDRVTFEIGPGGRGGIAEVLDETRDKANRGSDGFAAETMRFSP